MKFTEWLNHKNMLLQAAMSDCYAQDPIAGWQENHITTQIIKAVLGQKGEMQWVGVPQRAKWEVFKLVGELETSNGDIALLVNIRLGKTSFLEGVAYYEAKRQYYNNGEPIGYCSLDVSQLTRIHAATTNCHLLLYNIRVTKALPPETSTIVGEAKALPIPFLTTLKNSGAIPHGMLSSFGMPWLNFLSLNLRGFHLDFRPEAVAAIKAYRIAKEAPAFIVNAAVSHDPDLEPELIQNWVPDKNAYSHQCDAEILPSGSPLISKDPSSGGR